MDPDDGATNALYAEIDRLTSEMEERSIEQSRLEEVRFRRIDNLCAALDRVRALHQPYNDAGTEYCNGCDDPWPCANFLALSMPREVK